ncbi:CG33912, partial [Drosophila busckii]
MLVNKMCSSSALIFCLCASFILIVLADVTFTNLKCSFMDKSVAEFLYCRIKPVNRTHKYTEVYVKLYQLPINNASV